MYVASFHQPSTKARPNTARRIFLERATSTGITRSMPLSAMITATGAPSVAIENGVVVVMAAVPAATDAASVTRVVSSNC
jgi:hypothetical protein